jgi:hypothetical protein
MHATFIRGMPDQQVLFIRRAVLLCVEQKFETRWFLHALVQRSRVAESGGPRDRVHQRSLPGRLSWPGERKPLCAASTGEDPAEQLTAGAIA